MKKLKAGIGAIVVLGSLAMNACGAYASGGQTSMSLTPQEAVEYTMESLKDLDLERFNACTDNYVDTYCNWIGVPVEREYRVFNELQQPGIKLGKWKKKYEFHYKLAEQMMENLEWKIEDVKENEDRAEIMMEITNLNMADVMGRYEIYIWENMLESNGTGLAQMIRDVSKIADEEEGLLAFMESQDEENVSTLHVTATAYREDGAWKVHLDDELINAFMGNINAEEYSDEIRQRLGELERLQDRKLDEWEEEFSDKIEQWEEGFMGVW